MLGWYSIDPPKLDSRATDGLVGVYDSLAYRVHEIESHFHGKNLCYGKDTGSELLLDSLVPFQLQAGTGSAWGSEVVITAGGVIELGSTTRRFDFGRIVVVTASANAGKIYEIQILYGTGLVGAASILTSLYYIVPAAGGGKSSGINIPCPRVTCNNKLWAKAKSDVNSATIDLLFDVHTYPG